MRESSYEKMVSPEADALDISGAADAFDMHTMQAFRGDIGYFIRSLDQFKGELSETLKEENPEIAGELAGYNFEPRDIINIFNDYIAFSCEEMKEDEDKNLEVSENINEFGE